MKSFLQTSATRWLATVSLGLALAALSINPASAAIYTWTGAGADANWTTTANWNPNTSFPQAGDICVFKTNGSPRLTPSQATTLSFNQMWFTNGGNFNQTIGLPTWNVANGAAGIYTNFWVFPNFSNNVPVNLSRNTRTMSLAPGTNVIQNDTLDKTLYFYGNAQAGGANFPAIVQSFGGMSRWVVAGPGTTVMGADSSGNLWLTAIRNGSGTVQMIQNGPGKLVLVSSVGNSSTGGFILNGGQVVINNGGIPPATGYVNPNPELFGTNSAIGTGTFTINGGSIENTSGADVTLISANPQVWNGNFAYAGSLFNFNLGSGAVTLSNTVQVTVSNNTLSMDGVISGSGYGITKAGPGTLTLNGANTYTGNTTVNAGTLTLGASGSLGSGSTVNLGAGGTFDVTSQATWTLGSGASLTASGTASPAQINGNTVDLGSRPVTLNFDGANASLSASATLNLNGGITVNNTSGSPLANGTYTLISASSITGTPYLASLVGGAGIVAGSSAALQISGGLLQLTVQTATASTTTIARHTGTGSSSTYGAALQFDVTVTGSSPTGGVVVKDGGAGGTIIGFGALSGGTTTVTLSPLNSLAVGSHANIVAVYAGDVNNQASTSAALSPAQSVSAKALTLSGATVQSKYYDATTNATITGGTLVGVLSGDTVTPNLSGYFANAGPGAGIAVTSTSTLGGASAGNYTLTQPTGLTGTIYSSGTPGIWTGSAGNGLWETASNWNNIAVPNGFNVTADFSTLDITSDQTVNLTAAEVVGNLIFGDSNTNTAAGWTLANNGNAANTLTFASATPTVTVNALGTNKTAAISAVVAGNSGLTKMGNGTLSLSGANTFLGGVTISNGTVRAENALALGDSANACVIQSGATLDINGQSLGNGRGSVIVAGNGVGGNGAIINSGAFQVQAMTNLVMTADTTLSAVNEWQLRNNPVSGLDMGGHTLTKIGGSKLYIQLSAGSLVKNPGNVIVNDGILMIGFSTWSYAGATKTMTFNSGTTFHIYKGSGNYVFSTVLNGATLRFSPEGAFTGNWTGGIALSGNNTILAETNATLNNVISGSGNLVKTGTRTLTLAGTNTYYGNTTVSNGTLRVANANFAPNSTIAVATNSVLQLDLAVTNTITNLVLSGVSQPVGVYNSANASPYIAGSGALQVVAGAVAPPLPTFSPVAGSYYGAQTVTISSSAGSTIIYTTDGSDPTSSGTAVTNINPATVVVPAGVVQTIKAFARAAGLNSAVATAIYDTTVPPVAPAIVPPGGVYAGALTVVMTSSPGSTIYYTTNGSDPATSGTAISGPSPLSAVVPANTSQTIRACAKVGSLTGPGSAASYATSLGAYSTLPMLASTNDSPFRTNYTGVTGYTFTTGTNGQIVVSALGYFDWTGQGTNGTGLVTTHQVGLWDAGGNLLGSVTVPEGTAGNWVNHFWYAPLATPFVLAPNSTYTIGASQNTSDPWPGQYGTYSPGYTAPLFTGFSPLGNSNAVYGGTFPNTPPAIPDATGGTSVWPVCNLLGAAPTPVVASPAKQGDGSMQFSTLGTAGSTYRIWASTNVALSPIIGTWSNIASGTYQGTNVVINDTNAPQYPRRFYSVTIP